MSNETIDVTTVPVPKDAPRFDDTDNSNKKSSALVVDLLLYLLLNFGGLYVQYTIEKERQKNRGI